MAKTYTSSEPVFDGKRLIPPGEEFTTDAPKGGDWVEVKQPEAPKASAKAKSK